MKKLLSLLSILTISGTAVPTTIAASPYQNEKIDLNIDLNNNEINNDIDDLNLSGIEFYYNKSKDTEEVFLDWYDDVEKYYKIDVNLGKINPTLYNQIIFFDKEEIYSKVSWGNTPYRGKNMNEVFIGEKFKKIIKSVEVNSNSEIDNYANMYLLSVNPGGSSVINMLGTLKTGITFYWDGKNEEWHLQILGHLYGKTWGSALGGGAWINFGKGFRLYQ